MSKVTGGLLSMVARGALGKILTYQDRKWQGIAQVFSQPPDDPTTKQKVLRNYIKATALAWTGKTESQRERWRNIKDEKGNTGYPVFTADYIKTLIYLFNFAADDTQHHPGFGEGGFGVGGFGA